MPDLFDMKPFGGPELQKMLNQLPKVAQERIVPAAIRKSAIRVRAQVALAWSGVVVQEKTGKTSDAFADAPIRKFKDGDDPGMVILGITLPSKESLGIDEDSKYYYPTAVEYGVSRGSRQFAAKAPIRKTVDRVADSEFAAVGRDIGKAIERRAKRLVRAAKKVGAG